MKKVPIVSLSSALKTTGLGLFLVVGFNGCSDDRCKNLRNELSQKQIDECKRTGGVVNPMFFPIHSTSPTTSGYFGSSSSSAYSSGSVSSGG